MTELSIYDGRWLLVESDDMNDFLDAVGVSPQVKAKALEKVNGMIKEVNHSGDEWNMKTILNDNVINYHYIVGQLADKVALDGRPMKGRLTFEDGVMVEEAEGDGFSIRHERRVRDNQLFQTITGNGVTIHRRYTKLE